MKNAVKVVNLLGKPKVISSSLNFPLSQQDQEFILTMKNSFRQSFVDFKVYSLGLSAPQLGVNKRMFLMPSDFSYGTISNFKLIKEIVKDFEVFINPSIVSTSEKIIPDFENCLSVDSNQYRVMRPSEITVEYFIEDGTLKKQTLKGLKARVFQHEYDHLEGILIPEIGILVSEQQTRKPRRDVRRGSRRKLQNMF